MLKKLKRTNRLLYSVIVGSGLILFWRGAWGLLDLYFLPDIPGLSYAISLVAGVAILLLDDMKLEEIENR